LPVLLEVGDISAVGHCHATRFPDFFDHGLRRRQRTAGAVACATEIVDDDFRAAACKPKRVRAAKTIARAGDDRDASIKPDCHEASSRIRFSNDARARLGLSTKTIRSLISRGLPGQARQLVR